MESIALNRQDERFNGLRIVVDVETGPRNLHLKFEPESPVVKNLPFLGWVLPPAPAPPPDGGPAPPPQPYRLPMDQAISKLAPAASLFPTDPWVNFSIVTFAPDALSWSKYLSYLYELEVFKAPLSQTTASSSTGSPSSGRKIPPKMVPQEPRPRSHFVRRACTKDRKLSMAPTSVGLTVARTHLPLGPRWGITLLLCAPGGASPTPQQSPGGASLPGAGIARASW